MFCRRNLDRCLSRMPKERPGTEPGVDQVTALLDNLGHQGSNGKHSCLIVEAMGPDMASMKDILEGRSLSRGVSNCPPLLA